MTAKFALFLAICMTGLGAMPVWLMSAYSPEVIVDFGLNQASFGFLISSFYIYTAAFGIFGGRLVARIGWLAGTMVVALLAGLSLLIIGSTASLAVLALALVIAAIANVISQPAANLGLASTVREARQGLAFGIKQAALPVTTLLVGISVPLFANIGGWRLAFFTTGVFSVLLLAYLLYRSETLKNARGALGWFRNRKQRKANSQARPKSRVSMPLKLLATGSAVATGTTISMASFLVLFAVSKGLTPAQGGQLLAAGSLVGIFARVLSGYMADREGRRRLRVVALMMAGGSVGFVILALASNPIWILLGTALVFGLGWAWTGVFHLSVVRIDVSKAASSTSIIQTAMAIGAIFGPSLFGLLSNYSFTAAWGASAAAMLVASALIFYGRQRLIDSRKP